MKVNVREEGMLGQVLPQLQTFIEENCTGGAKARDREQYFTDKVGFIKIFYDFQYRRSSTADTRETKPPTCS